MFSSKSFFRKGRLGVFCTALLVLYLLGGAALFTACDTGGNTPSSLEGVWSSGTGEGYEIYGDTLIYNGVDSKGNGRFSFIAAIENNPDFTAPSGVLIVKYLMKPNYDPTWSERGSSYYEEPANSYMGVYWRELNSGSVALANAYDVSGTEEPTKEDAVAKFTLAANENFVSWNYVVSQARQYPNRGGLKGIWDDTTSFSPYLIRVIITGTTYTVYADGDGDGAIDLDGGFDYIHYSGFIEETDPVSALSGNIYVKLSNVDGLGSDIGYYLVAHWENLSSSSVKLADVETGVIDLNAAKTINSGSPVDDAYITTQSIDYYSYDKQP
jgi:hypothetical protein